MSIFNSLGSNYNLGFAIRHLFNTNSSAAESKLIKYLEEKYEGKVVLTYKGRESLRLALITINKRNESVVGICGFTCYAVYEAIAKEGYKIEYLDIEKDSLNFSIETLKSAFKNNPKLKIIFIQNTFGSPCDMENISKFCKENKIILVEDLAHSIGTKYLHGKEAGTVGDFVMLSFSQDKIIDNVSGGALIVRNTKINFNNFDLTEVNSAQQWKDRLYPLFSFKIRITYAVGFGKILHYFLKKLNILSNPMIYHESDSVHLLPTNYITSIYQQFLKLGKDIEHRRKIAEIYSETLSEIITSSRICDSLNLSSNLRFSIFVDDRKSLITYLKENNIYVSDIWYDSPVAPKKYLHKTSYKKGDCPNSEYVSERILNLPTHKSVSDKDAIFIAERINEWLKL